MKPKLSRLGLHFLIFIFKTVCHWGNPTDFVDFYINRCVREIPFDGRKFIKYKKPSTVLTSDFFLINHINRLNVSP